MAYVKIDDGFHDHPRVVDVPLAAIGLWTLALSWSRKHLTDGHVPRTVVARLSSDRAVKRSTRCLVDAGLWQTTDTGYVFRDYLQHNDSKEVITEAKRRDRERKQRAKNAKFRAESERNPTGIRLPTQPNPTQPNPDPPCSPPAGDTTKPKKKKPDAGQRLAENWEPPENVYIWASEKYRLAKRDVDKYVEPFREYWCGVPAARGRKTAKGWPLALQSWIRRDLGPPRQVQAPYHKVWEPPEVKNPLTPAETAATIKELTAKVGLRKGVK